MLALLLGLAVKIVVIQGFDPDRFAAKATDKRTQASVLAAERGKILDMNGAVLAQSIVRYDIVGAPNVNTPFQMFKRFNEDNIPVEVTRDQGLRELADLPWPPGA